MTQDKPRGNAMNKQFINRYSPVIRATVSRFIRKNAGYRNSLIFDGEELYQECVAVSLARFAASGKTLDEYSFSAMDVRHIICQYVQSMLPVKTNRATSQYTKRMQTYRTEEYKTELHGSAEQTDHDFMIDCDMIAEKLDETQQQMLKMIIAG